MQLTDSRGLPVSTQSVAANYSRAEDFGRHALIAYNAASRDEHQRRMLAKLEESADGVHINANITREFGLPLARAIVAMVSGRHAEAIEQLLPVRSRVNRIGGSYAQRDRVQLACIEATLRCGNGRLARALDVTGNAAAAKPVRNCGGTPPDLIGYNLDTGDCHVREFYLPRASDIDSAGDRGVRSVLRHPCLRLMPAEWRVPGGLSLKGTFTFKSRGASPFEGERPLQALSIQPGTA